MGVALEAFRDLGDSLASFDHPSSDVTDPSLECAVRKRLSASVCSYKHAPLPHSNILQRGVSYMAPPSFHIYKCKYTEKECSGHTISYTLILYC
ncbi:hypothetical protein XELAEV_18041457mg, partial [Xenopus laevis]